MFKKLAMLCIIGLFAVATSVAHAAATETFTLTSGGTCCGATGDFGTIKLTQTTADQVTVVETLASGVKFDDASPGDTLGFDLTGVTAPTITLSGADASMFTVAGSHTDNPFGTFTSNIECDNSWDCANNSTLTFTVNSTSGVTIADFTSTTSSYGKVFFTSDIIDSDLVDCPTPYGDVGAFAGVVASGAPEPSSLLLLGTGILGLAGTIRRRLMA